MGVLTLNSDGLKSQWSVDPADAVNRDPSVIAGIIYRDNRRDRDDATVLVLRECPEESTARPRPGVGGPV
jgi:hypothetical protein